MILWQSCPFCGQPIEINLPLTILVDCPWMAHGYLRTQYLKLAPLAERLGQSTKGWLPHNLGFAGLNVLLAQPVLTPMKKAAFGGRHKAAKLSAGVLLC